LNYLVLLSVTALTIGGLLFTSMSMLRNVNGIDHNATFTSPYFYSTHSVRFGYDEGIFEITNVSIHHGTNETKIIGMIENKDPDRNTIENVSLAVQAFDKGNHLMSVAEGRPQMSTFRLGDKTGFEILDNDLKLDLDHIFIQILAAKWGTDADEDTTLEKSPS
jgi:hypothetical protein